MLVAGVSHFGVEHFGRLGERNAEHLTSLVALPSTSTVKPQPGAGTIVTRRL